MNFILALIPSKAKLYAVFAAVGAFFLAFLRWDAKKDALKAAELKAAKDATKRRNEAQDAVEKSHAGGAAWADRLRNNKH